MAWQESKYKEEYCKTATKILAGGESLAGVCAELDICRATLYNWRDAHPEFANALNRGLQKAQREWEKLGRNGISGEIDKFSPSPWIFTMKNRFRDDYKDDKSEGKDTANAFVEKLLMKQLDDKE
jgi:hypothetical protein